jgi:hypothetical protein
MKLHKLICPIKTKILDKTYMTFIVWHIANPLVSFPSKTHLTEWILVTFLPLVLNTSYPTSHNHPSDPMETFIDHPK